CECRPAPHRTCAYNENISTLLRQHSSPIETQIENKESSSQHFQETPSKPKSRVPMRVRLFGQSPHALDEFIPRLQRLPRLVDRFEQAEHRREAYPTTDLGTRRESMKTPSVLKEGG